MPPFELEERFFDLSIDMLCVLDFSGYFRRLNRAWETTLGFTTQELMAKPFIEFVHPDDRDRTSNQNRDVRGGGQALSFENRYLCRDGSHRWLLWNATLDGRSRASCPSARTANACATTRTTGTRSTSTSPPTLTRASRTASVPRAIGTWSNPS